jgi:hypothetical protein
MASHPRHHWATVVLDEVEAARLQHLKLQDPERDKSGPTTPEATFTRKHPQPGQDKHVTMSLEAEGRETVPGRAVINYFGMIDGKRTHVGTIIGSLDVGTSRHPRRSTSRGATLRGPDDR